MEGFAFISGMLLGTIVTFGIMIGMDDYDRQDLIDRATCFEKTKREECWK